VKILFFPSDSGGGFGHLSRCLAMAYEAKKRGHFCRFMLNDLKFKKAITESFPAYVSCHKVSFTSTILKWMIFIYKKREVTPLFTEISGLDYQVLRDGLANEGIVKEKLREYKRYVREFQPDLLIGDTNLLAWIISRIANIPLVQIVRYASHPETAELIWWKNADDNIVRPEVSALFNPLLKHHGLRTINRAEDLLYGDLYLVPSIPEIEPIPENDQTVFTGELTLEDYHGETPYWLAETDQRLPLVYITIGGGAGPVGSKIFLKSIVDAFANQRFQLIVSTSGKFNDRDLPLAPRNIVFRQWVPGRLVIAKADLIVFHGGYGTMMETLSSGKPSVVIPFQTEQEGNGRRLENLECARVVRLSKEEYQVVNGRWKYGAFSYCVQNQYDLSNEELFQSVSQVLHDESYLNGARKLQAKIKNYRGVIKAMEVIENLWS
jgi:UDP:flavonoid glycosyltransferase YjiC (YdhE family)